MTLLLESFMKSHHTKSVTWQEQDEAQKLDRKKYLDQIVSSSAPKKLIVAGPGTGKSFTFKTLLAEKPGANLALTFIKALHLELARTLEGLADSYTFHGFSKKLLHEMPTEGITTGVSYYPPLIILLADDISSLGLGSIAEKDLEKLFHYLDDSAGLLAISIRSGNYYDAVGHIDSVFRALKHFQANPQSVPSFSQIVVDEYQDFSLMESQFIAALSAVSPILIVGDDDQALYDFKHASADYVRTLAADESYEKFELPYCSRCTEVLVAATHTIINRAQRAGLLTGRLPKQYECFMPDKRAESLLYPLITHVECSVERNTNRYMAQYIHQRILEIPPAEIAESRADGYPTVLITGPVQFTQRVHSYLKDYFKDIEIKASSELGVKAIDGYIRLARNPQSRLGWRILLYVYPLDDVTEILQAALVEGREMAEIIPSAYVAKHLAQAEVLKRMKAEETVSAEEIRSLETATNIHYLELQDYLNLQSDELEDEGQENETEPSINESEPSILVTSLIGSKGLQAAHVFVVGMNGNHFPRVNSHPTDQEVCSILVALTRARKSCTLLSCKSFGGSPLRRSIFLGWLDEHLEHKSVDAKYFASRS